MPLLKLTKFDVAERQLKLSIHLFFENEDPVSIHTLSQAAAQVLYDINDDPKNKSILRDNPAIRKDKKREWFNGVFRLRNFFKHGKSDKNEICEFNTEANDCMMYDAVLMHSVMKKIFLPECFVYQMWFQLKYPQLIKLKPEEQRNLELMTVNDLLPDHNNKAAFLEFIEKIRNKEIDYPNITLQNGL